MKNYHKPDVLEQYQLIISQFSWVRIGYRLAGSLAPSLMRLKSSCCLWLRRRLMLGVLFQTHGLLANLSALKLYDWGPQVLETIRCSLPSVTSPSMTVFVFRTNRRITMLLWNFWLLSLTSINSFEVLTCSLIRPTSLKFFPLAYGQLCTDPTPIHKSTSLLSYNVWEW